MKDKINVAELLKDCPSGMELDCTICEMVAGIVAILQYALEED